MKLSRPVPFAPATHDHADLILINPSYVFCNPILVGHLTAGVTVDWHLDWGASQFLTKQLMIGAVAMSACRANLLRPISLHEFVNLTVESRRVTRRSVT
jgi:hypothetical protein